MTRRRSNLVLVGLVFALLIPSGIAQEKTAKGSKDKVRDGLIDRVLHLMPPSFAAELKLSAEQGSQIKKLEQEFNAKRTTALMRSGARVMTIMESMDSDDAEKELAPVLALSHELTGGLLELRRTRVSYEKKMIDVLNPEQKAKFANLSERKLVGGRDSAANSKEGTATLHFYYTPQGQEKLRLTDEQKQKFLELQKDVETRLRVLLTEEQRSILDGANPPRKDAPATKKQDK